MKGFCPEYVRLARFPPHFDHATAQWGRAKAGAIHELVATNCDARGQMLTIAFYNAAVRILATMQIDVEDEYQKYLDEFPLPKD